MVPIGNVLPLGGLHETKGGGLQPPLAELVKNTAAPPGPVAATLRFDEQFKTSCGYTVTVNEQLVELPQVSLAEQVTVVVPTGKVLPLGGLQLTNGGGLQPPVAELVKNTVAPFGPVATVARFDEQVRTIPLVGGLTVTVKLQFVLPQGSLAVQVTVVVPIGKVLPLGGLHDTKGGGLHPPVAVEV